MDPNRRAAAFERPKRHALGANGFGGFIGPKELERMEILQCYRLWASGQERTRRESREQFSETGPQIADYKFSNLEQSPIYVPSGVCEFWGSRRL